MPLVVNFKAEQKTPENMQCLVSEEPHDQSLEEIPCCNSSFYSLRED